MANKEKVKMTHRYLARVVLEAETPLFVGSGETSLLKDALVQKDLHGFPMIQGTSLTGVLRHSLEDAKSIKGEDSLFGYQAPKGKKGLGSRLQISSAYLLLDKNGTVAEGLEIAEKYKELNKIFDDLPARQHVRINHQGVADKENNGLFDNEVVYKGCQFIFEIELKGTDKDEAAWQEVLNELASPLFRIGQGTRNGYGKLKVAECKQKVFKLKDESDFDAYLNFNPSFNAKIEVLQDYKPKKSDDLTHYQLVLKPDDFFMFGAGYGDDEVDNVPLVENTVAYNADILDLANEVTIIPGASIKGAISHRTAFYYNRKLERYANENDADKKVEPAEITGSNNKAVYSLFGEKGGEDNAQRGKVIINDLYLPTAKNDKIFNHVAIDRFTGGAMDGALFSEKVSYLEKADETITLDVFVEKNQLDDEIINALECALEDICKGLLPLGGMVTKGHGSFTGKLFKNENEIFNYDN